VEEFIYHQERGLPAAVFSSDVLFQVLWTRSGSR
jgi:hypothetical protein